jgi:phospholipid/cholesterol/gamma-HCH transport system substrate-binding protein
MRGRGRAQSLAASPTLVGAITTLIVIVAVFLAYNATNGLPFVPTYRVSVILPNGARVSPNNEVRIGGTRVGIVDSIEPIRTSGGRAAAKLDLKLDKAVDPLPAGTTVKVRYKSSFGLKYLQLTRGKGPGLKEGATIPVSHASSQTEFDDIANTFDARTRAANRVALQGYGDAFAARGSSLNETIQKLNPLFTNLKPVAEVLTDPNTRLNNFFPSLGRTAEIVAPVAEQQAQLFTNMAITFGALSEDPQALKDTISSGPPTLEQGTPDLRAQRPFLTDFADLNRRLLPGLVALRQTLPTLNSALTVGAPVVRSMPPVNRKLGQTFTELRSLVRQPQTKTSLLRLRETFDQAAPAATFIAPFQTVCNYWNYWFTWLPEHLTQRDDLGTTQQVAIIGTPSNQAPPPTVETPLGGYSGLQANGKAAPSVPTADNPVPNPDNKKFEPHTFPITHGNPYGPAVDASGNADCQAGQAGYLLGDLRVPGQPPSNPAIGVPDLPGDRGPTFAGRASVPTELHPRSLP